MAIKECEEDWKNLHKVDYLDEVIRCLKIITGADNEARLTDLVNKRSEWIIEERWRGDIHGTPERPEKVAMELIKNNDGLLHKMMDSRYDDVNMEIMKGRT